MKDIKILKAFTFLSVIASILCYFTVPYLQYPTNSWNSSNITYDTLSCADIFYNADKFGIDERIINGLIFLIIVSIILAIVLLKSKKNTDACFVLIAVDETLFLAFNGYLFYGFADIKERYAGLVGILIDVANIKFVYGIYLNMAIIIFAIIISIKGVVDISRYNRYIEYLNRKNTNNVEIP